MPVFEQGYRPYTGPVRRGPRAFAIAWQSFRPRLRWWVWLLMFPYMFFPHLLTAGFVYAFLMLDVRIPSDAATSVVAFSVNDPFSRLWGSIASLRPGLWWELLQTGFAGTGPVVVAAVTCAGILSADRRANALHLYFSRPVTRRDYLAGKTLTVIAFTSMVSFLPAILVWGEAVALQKEFADAMRIAWVPLSIVAASAVYSLWAAGLVMLFSVLLDRPVLAAISAIGTFLFLAMVSAACTSAFDDRLWRCLSPSYALGGFTAPLFGMDTPDWLPLPLCAVHAIAVPALCFTVVVRKLRAVEVVT